MPKLECPQCGAEVSANNIHCLKCDFELPEHYHAQNESEIHFFSDVLSFPFKAIWSQTSFEAIEHYREVADRGSVNKLLLLPAINNFVVIIGIYFLVGGNPYIDIGIDPLTFTVLGTCFFLILAFVRFLAFRIVSGKGNFVAQGYLDAIVTTDYLLLACFSIVILFITRAEGVSNFILVAGGFYLVIPSLVSLAAVHHLSGMRTIIGFFLSIVFTIPFYLLFQILFSFFDRTSLFEIREWGFFLLVALLLVVTLFVVLYMRQEEKLSENTHEKIPLKEPVIVMMQAKKIKYVLLFSIFSLFLIPIYFLVGILFDFYHKIFPIEIYDWRLMTIVSFVLFMILFFVFYVWHLYRLSQHTQEKVSIKEPFMAMMQVRTVIFLLLAGIVIVGFILLDNRYPNIHTEHSPYFLSFAPDYDPDLLYIGTREEEVEKRTFIEALNLSTGEIREIKQMPVSVERMRLDSSGDKLIFAVRDSSPGIAAVVNLDEMMFYYDNYQYLEGFGINNFSRNEIYFTNNKGGISVENSETPLRNLEGIEPNIQFYSVAIHPNGEILYLVADNQIKVVDAESKETLDTIRLGGKLRDAAVSPDGEHLYVADALWNRIRVIPINAQE